MKLTDEALGAVEFGRFRLLPHRRELRADGVAVELGSRAFDVLLVLTEARGALVTKDEILSRVWPDTVVEENNLVVQISTLRKALGADRDFIQTVSGRGYRFVAEMRISAPSSDAETRIDDGAIAEAARSALSSSLPTPVSGLIGRGTEFEELSDLPARDLAGKSLSGTLQPVHSAATGLRSSPIRCSVSGSPATYRPPPDESIWADGGTCGTQFSI
jgi:DNA-binding winged helix-turn-helix (wHTH) protein